MEEPKDSIPKATPLFSLGYLSITDSAFCELFPAEIESAVKRHCRGDWGMQNGEDWQAHDRALQLHGQILSTYQSSTGTKFWIVTERDRSFTSVP